MRYFIAAAERLSFSQAALNEAIRRLEAEGVAFVGRRPDVAWAPIQDVDPSRNALARRADETSPLVPAFADVVPVVAADTAA